MKNLILFITAIAFFSCQNNKKFEIDQEYLERYEKRIENDERKGVKYRWMVGRFELDPNSTNQFGSGPENEHKLDIGEMPPVLGSIEFKGDSLIFHASNDIEVSAPNGSIITDYYLTFNKRGHSDELHYGSFYWFVTSFGGKKFLRILDTLNAAAAEYKGFEKYAPTADYIFEGRVNYYAQPKEMEVPTIFDFSERINFVGAVSFEHKGQEHTLQLQEGGLLMFGDETSGDETYGAGRYLFVDAPPEDGAIVLDFNFSINPPCTYSDFTTCAFAPRENWLPFKVLAGEKSKKVL